MFAPQPSQPFPGFEPFVESTLPSSETLTPEDLAQPPPPPPPPHMFEHRRCSTDSGFDDLTDFFPNAPAPGLYSLMPPPPRELELLHAPPRTHPAEMFTLEHAVAALLPPLGPEHDGPWPPFEHHEVDFIPPPEGFLHPHLVEHGGFIFPAGLPPHGFPHLEPGLPSPGVFLPPPPPLSGALDIGTGQFYMPHEHPRLRTPQACDKCRTRKAKVRLLFFVFFVQSTDRMTIQCSGERPTCKRCMDRGLICSYAPDKKVRGIPQPQPKQKRHRRGESVELSPGGGPRRESVGSIASTATVTEEDNARRFSIDSAASDLSSSSTSASSPAMSDASLSAHHALTEANLGALSLNPPALRQLTPPPSLPTSLSGQSERRRPPPLNLGGLSNARARTVSNELLSPPNSAGPMLGGAGMYADAPNSARAPMFTSPWERMRVQAGAMTSPPNFSPQHVFLAPRARLPSLAYSSGTDSPGFPLSPTSAPPMYALAFEPPPLMSPGLPFGVQDGGPQIVPHPQAFVGLPQAGYVFPPGGAEECTPRQEWPEKGAPVGVGMQMPLGMGMSMHDDEEHAFIGGEFP